MSFPDNRWDSRYAAAGDACLFGEAPNAFLAAQKPRHRPGWTALAVADGEGRNGVWLAEQGLAVMSVDSSAVAQAKARRLAAKRGVILELVPTDLEHRPWPEEQFDLVAGIFIQFADPAFRTRLFDGMRRALKPGGLLLLEGDPPEQIAYGTGGPPVAENLYTEALLREAFGAFNIIELNSRDAVVEEGPGHAGMSALIDLVAGKPPRSGANLP
jgi:SAM-dependent methyltransferase